MSYGGTSSCGDVFEQKNSNPDKYFSDYYNLTDSTGFYIVKPDSVLFYNEYGVLVSNAKYSYSGRNLVLSFDSVEYLLKKD